MYELLRTHSHWATLQPGGAELLVLVEASRGAAVAVVVARHHHHRLLAAREVPEARQRLLVLVDVADQVGEEPLLLVGLRDGHLAQVDPIGLAAAEEEVVRADRREAVALLVLPGGVALARVDDRAGQIEGEGCRLTAVGAHVPDGHRGVAGGGARVAEQRGDCGRPVGHVAVGAAVELHRLIDDARPGRP